MTAGEPKQATAAELHGVHVTFALTTIRTCTSATAPRSQTSAPLHASTTAGRIRPVVAPRPRRPPRPSESTPTPVLPPIRPDNRECLVFPVCGDDMFSAGRAHGSRSEPGAHVRPQPSHTALNSAQLPRFPLQVLGFRSSPSSQDATGGQGVVGSNPAVPTVGEARRSGSFYQGSGLFHALVSIVHSGRISRSTGPSRSESGVNLGVALTQGGLGSDGS